MTGFAGLARLLDELSLHEGDVPDALAQPLAVTPTYQVSRDAFLLRLPMGLAFHYLRGAGTAFARLREVTDDEVSLFFEGSVFGAIAWLNGYVPLHASAVLHDGQAYAFTGPSGEGKSTLAAALAERGMPLCSDDVLVLDLSDPHRVMALPGPERMKLWDDALALTGRAAGQAVRPGIDKFYVTDVAFAEREAVPVRKLYFLASDGVEQTGIEPIEGMVTFNRMRSAYYRPRFFRALAAQDHYFQTAVRLSRAIEMARFHRPRSRSEFSDGVDMIAADIRATA